MALIIAVSCFRTGIAFMVYAGGVGGFVTTVAMATLVVLMTILGGLDGS